MNASTEPLRELALEAFDVRAHRRHPVGVERLSDEPPLLLAHVRHGEVNSRAHRRASAFAGTPITVTPGGTSRVTTAPAPTTEPSPTFTPGSTIPPVPTCAPRPIT